VTDKDPTIKVMETGDIDTDHDSHFWDDHKDIDPWGEHETVSNFDLNDGNAVLIPADVNVPKNRVDHIKESYAMLRQFTSKELKILMNLKRNTSPKAWSVREDLVVLTLHMSNREIAEILTDRNKEAVKKRLQLLKSKGLAKRQAEPLPG
jgi:hypothetical protein